MMLDPKKFCKDGQEHDLMPPRTMGNFSCDEWRCRKCLECPYEEKKRFWNSRYADTRECPDCGGPSGHWGECK